MKVDNRALFDPDGIEDQVVSPEEDYAWLASEESEFRYWAFQHYFRGPYESEPDITLRFAKALAASVAAIRNPALRAKWKGKK